jgi:hypothetical protein
LINHTIAFEKKPTKIKKFLGRKKKERNRFSARRFFPWHIFRR